MIRNRTKPPRTVEPDPIEDQAPQVAQEEDLATLAEQHRAAAEQLRERASQQQDEAAAIIATAEQDAARIAAEARRRELALIAEATAAGRQAAELEQHATWLADAAAEEAKAVRADQRASDLQAERNTLAAEIADHDAVIGAAAAGRLAAEGKLTEARQAPDVRGIRENLAEIDAQDHLAASRTTDRAEAVARYGVIGDGTDAFPGLLAEALSAAGAHRRSARHILNQVWPDRPEAVQDRALADVNASLAALGTWAAAQQPAEPAR
jgi:hypothetical protein